MQSRENFQKSNKRNEIFIIIIGLVLIIGVVAGVFVYNHHVAVEKEHRKFAVNHFNPNVQIYGVAVGKLTVAAATKKINQQAKNEVQLKHNQVTLTHNAARTITQQQVASYFKKQHTDLPRSQTYQYDNQPLTKAKAKLQRISQASLTYQVAGKNYHLQAKDLINSLTFKNGKYTFNNVTNLTKKLNQIDKEVTTLHQSYRFTVPTKKKVKGKTITIKNETYGWGVHTKRATAAIEQALLNNAKTLDGSNNIYGLGYSTYGLGYGKENHGIGKDYIVVSLKQQRLWLVKNNKVVVYLNDVVTGTKDGSVNNRTPLGVWYLHYKKHHTTLHGRNDNGTKYASPVNYWMPFTLSGCGLHDASWRTDWSKKAYLRGGSHGCINIKPTHIKKVWQNVEKHEPVIIYN